MRAVLGIDAAWTATQSSGVAVVVESADGWLLMGVASSYQRFYARAAGSLTEMPRPSGLLPDAVTLLAAAAKLCGRPIDLVAIDMPLAHSPIVGRRVSDNAVSRAYGGRKCSTHSPSPARPGRVSDHLKIDFEQAGYPLLTSAAALPGTIEVYPHPALVELAGASMRLVRSYWPWARPSGRRLRLYKIWSEIIKLLDEKIGGVASALPAPDLSAGTVELKAYEDSLDAIVCAWVAICALEGKARAFGDENSAIWIPKPLPANDDERASERSVPSRKHSDGANCR
jgi:predicted RNase H-like nuclease